MCEKLGVRHHPLHTSHDFHVNVVKSTTPVEFHFVNPVNVVRLRLCTINLPIGIGIRKEYPSLTHWPTVDSQPIILDCIHAWDFIFAPRSMVDFERHTPGVGRITTIHDMKVYV